MTPLDDLAQRAYERYGKVFTILGLARVVACGHPLWPVAGQGERFFYVCDQRHCGRHSRDQQAVDDAAWAAYVRACQFPPRGRYAPTEQRKILWRSRTGLLISTSPVEAAVRECVIGLYLLNR